PTLSSDAKDLYHLTSVVINGKTYSAADYAKNLPTTIGKEAQTVVYNYAPNVGKITTEVMGLDNKVITSSVITQTGDINTLYNNVNEQIPDGYHISEITVDGVTVPVNKLANLVIGNNPKTVIYHIAKDQVKETTGSVKIEIENSDGKIIQSVTTTGEVGSAYKNLTPDSKVAYTTVNGVQNGTIPNTIVKGDTIIIYHLEPTTKPTPAPTPTVGNGIVNIKVVDQNGNVIGTMSHMGSVGSNFAPATIPTGDTVNNITVNGKVVNDVPTTIENGTTNIVYHVTVPQVTKPAVKEGTVNIKIVDQNGNVIGQSTQSGEVGSDINPLDISNNDTIKSITVDGQTVSDAPTTIVDGTTNIVYHINVPSKKVSKDKLQIKVVTAKGEVIYDSNSTVDSGTTINGITIPKGYHLVNKVATVDGKDVNTVPTTVNGDTKIVYTVAKDTEKQPVNPTVNNGTVTIKYVYDGKVLEESNYNTAVGTPFELGNTPKGYKVESIDINGQETTDVPTTVQNGNTSIVINLTKPEANKVPVVKQENGQVNIKIVTESGQIVYESDSDVKVGTTIQQPQIPAGYHLVKTVIAINGNGTNTMPSKVVKGKIIIVYTIAKNVAPTIPVVKPVSNNKNNSVNNTNIDNTGKATQTTNTPVNVPSSTPTDTTSTTNKTNVSSNNNQNITANPIVQKHQEVAPEHVVNSNVSSNAPKETKITSLPDTGLSSLGNNNTERDVAGAAGLVGVLVGVLEVIRRKKK
ncbi:MAG: hypothetical protein ACRDCW_12885, partial [Sarcina sp.]